MFCTKHCKRNSHRQQLWNFLQTSQKWELFLQGDNAKANRPVIPISMKGYNNSTINHCQSLFTSPHISTFHKSKIISSTRRMVCHFQACTWTNLTPDGKLSAENPEQNQIICQISLWWKDKWYCRFEKTKIVHSNMELWCFSDFKRITSECKLTWNQ